MIILFINLNTLDSMVGMVLTIFPLLCTLRTASVLTLYKNIYVNRYRAKFNKKSYRRDFHRIWFSSISYLFIIIVIMKVFLENTRRNPSSGMFNFLFYVQIYFKIHFETYTIWDIWKFDARMKILLLPCLDYFVDPRFVRLIELRPCLVSCQSFSRCLGQAKDGKIFISRRSRWNWRKFGKTRNLGSWLY